MSGRSIIVRTGAKSGAKLDNIRIPTVYPCEIMIGLAESRKQVSKQWSVTCADERAFRYVLAKLRLLLHEIDGINLEPSIAGANAGERTDDGVPLSANAGDRTAA